MVPVMYSLFDDLDRWARRVFVTRRERGAAPVSATAVAVAAASAPAAAAPAPAPPPRWRRHRYRRPRRVATPVAASDDAPAAEVAPAPEAAPSTPVASQIGPQGAISTRPSENSGLTRLAVRRPHGAGAPPPPHG